MSQERDDLQKAHAIRSIDHGDEIQLICSDDRGLLSVYFEPGQFDVFLNYLCAVNLDLDGLPIEFDRDRVVVPRCGKCFFRKLLPQKTF